MSKLIGNVAILVAGGFLFVGGAIAIGVLFMYAVGVALARRLKAVAGRPTPAIS